MAVLNVQKFDINKIINGASIYIYDNRKQDAMVLLKEILPKKNINRGIVITNNKDYESVIPKQHIYENYTPELVKSFVLGQHNLCNKKYKQIKERKESNGRGHVHPTFEDAIIDSSAYFIMDDCMEDFEWIKERSIKTIVYNNRHLNILNIMVSSYLLYIPPQYMANIDYIFIFPDNDESTYKHLYKQFGGYFANFKMFKNTLKYLYTKSNKVGEECISRYCLVINYTRSARDIGEIICWHEIEYSRITF